MVLSHISGIMRKRTLQILPNVYQLTMMRVNIILIVEEELTLIDTGFRGSSAQITDFIHRLGRSVEEISLIIITHSHFDHVGGLPELKSLTKAKVAAHKAEILLECTRMTSGLMRIPPFSVLRSVFSVKSSEVDIQLEGEEVLKPLGGLKVIHTPGHTPGSISLFSPQNKLLIVGDALNKRRWLPPRIVSTDLAQALNSIKRMAQLDFDILCFGHGRPLTGDVRNRMLDWLDKIRD